ncbi:hypothetical protein ACTXT7_003305 [Hymenolepis weldensis]
MQMNWPPRGRENSIVNALLTHSERLSLSEECMAWHDGPKSRKVNARHLAKDLQVSEETIKNVLQRLKHKSLAFLNGVFSLYQQKQLKRIVLRVNADANAYVETLQIMVVKPPWIDSQWRTLSLLTRFGSIP